MNYVILSYFEDGSLTNHAIIFGKYNLKLIESKNEFNLYKFELNNSFLFFPIKKNNNQLQIGEENKIFSTFTYLNECKKIIILPNHNGFDVLNYWKNNKIFDIRFQGDSIQSEYDNDISKIFSVKQDSKFLENCFFDIKLCIPYFFYRHQLSLIDFDKVDKFKEIISEDKIFYYSRRLDEGRSNLRDRAYFIKKLNSKVSCEFLDSMPEIHKNIELSRINYGLYHLGNFFDYNNCMFNIVFETQEIDCKDSQTWISEKSVFAILLSNPFFLVANNFILKALKELDIELLNDEFVGNDTEEKFDNFCSFINNSTKNQRKELYLKMNYKQKLNREKILNYIYSIKSDVVNVLIK